MSICLCESVCSEWDDIKNLGCPVLIKMFVLRKSMSQHTCCTMSMYEGHKMLLRARKNEINVLSESGFLVELRI